MLKRFFITVLGTVTGIWIFIIMFFLALSLGLASAFSSGKSVGSASVLYIDLTGSISERKYVPTVENILFGDANGENFTDIVTSIHLAKYDKKIQGIYINCGDSELGIASRGEIVQAILDFKTSGKWVYAYADNYSQGDYYIATAADEIYLNPIGSVDIHGVSSMTLFYKNLLDKIGVKAEVVKVGQYKSAVEPFLLTEMSEASIEQTKVFIDNIWSNVAGDIAQRRGVDISDVNAWADSLSITWPASRCYKAGMVTGLMYRSDVENIICSELGITIDEVLPTISAGDYMSKHSKKLGKENKRHVAVLYAVGDIVDSGSDGIVGPDMVDQIITLACDDNVAGMVLRVNSGGGSAFASEQIWHALEQFMDSGKPLFVSMGDYAASGGYYISCGADRIYADANTLTGSIGIFGLMFDVQDLLEDKLGINTQVVETNPGSTMMIPYKPLSQKQLEAMQHYVDNGYDTFVYRVARGRGMLPEEVLRIAGGRVWDGQSALKLHLIDQIGDLHQAVCDMALMCGLESNKYVCYPIEQYDFWSMAFGQVKANLGTEEKYIIDAAYLRQIKDMSPVQARMETIILQ